MASDTYRDFVAVAAKEGLEKYEYTPKIRDTRIRDRLAIARRDNQLVLVLGAGVSLPSGLDSWQSLVRNAAAEMFAGTGLVDIVPVLNGSRRSSTVQIRFCEASAQLKTAFRLFLVEALYRNYDPTRSNESLDALCSVILGLDGGPPIDKIITYNFDNLLERALQVEIDRSGLDLTVTPIYSLELYRKSPKPRRIRVLHPHGYLPFGEDFGSFAELPIVFSETDYHRNFLDYSYWANTTQLNAFARSTCLFVGLSFECANMRRLLDYVRMQGACLHKHAAVMRVHTGDPRQFENYLVEKDLESFGVEPVWLTDYGQIPDFVRSIKA